MWQLADNTRWGELLMSQLRCSAACAATFPSLFGVLPAAAATDAPHAVSLHNDLLATSMWRTVHRLPAIVQRLAGERLLCAQLLFVVVHVFFIEHLCDSERSNSGR